MQHRPVGFLIWMFVIFLVGAFVVSVNSGQAALTNMGQLVLQNLQKTNTALELNSRAYPSSMSGRDLALAYGLLEPPRLEVRS